MHTIKGSSAMMMFNQIALVAHSMEDLFFFIRANKDVQIDFEGLSDLVLSGIDFIKAEMNKIENGHAADGLADELIAKINKLLETMKSTYEGKSETPPAVSSSSSDDFPTATTPKQRHRKESKNMKNLFNKMKEVEKKLYTQKNKK